MVAFVTPSAAPLTSSASRFATGSSQLNDDRIRAACPATRRTTTMTILDGLDTSNQAPYSFSRYILGPFQPATLTPNSTDDEREVVIRAAYRHIFGNAYLMEEERAELSIAESQFKMGRISAKEFVRALAKSSAYKTRFFEGASQYRFIELNFMHLLGRAPDTREEMTEHHDRYIKEGVDAEIDSYIDSEEYDSVFGNYNIPFLRFRGAYTPCDSFNKQCALKGGWANSDKAMGGAAISGYNGSDGMQVSSRIPSYITPETTPYEEVAENTPLKTTAPNWYACPNPALPPTPVYITAAEVRALSERISSLQSQYDIELKKKQEGSKDALAPFRSMVDEMALMLQRGPTYGDPMLVHPEAKLGGTESALADAGCKASDYKKYSRAMENDTLSRLERDLEEAKALFRVYNKALAQSTPITPSVAFPGLDASVDFVASTDEVESRPRVKAVPRAAPTPTPAPAAGTRGGPLGALSSAVGSILGSKKE